MQLSNQDIIDLFLRVAALGQLLLLCGVFGRRPFNGPKLAFLSVALCTGAYLLLTAPIPDPYYGNWRNLLLVLTDALGYSVWFTALYFLDDDFNPARWPGAVKVALGGLALWHLYFFGVLAGRGLFHDLSHGVAIVLMGQILYVAVKGRSDDLIDSRRRARVVIAIVASAFGLYLAATQLVGAAVRQTALFGLGNSLFILCSVTLLARYILTELLPSRRDTAPQSAANTAPRSLPTPSPRLKEKLEAFMADRGYCQTGLTIAALARQLDCPEHHLRRLINATLGFRNFTEFLNSYRLRDACNQLADPDNHSPILTLALELGYGSIGPFNRAFKTKTGLTPTQYRASFQNRA